MQSELEGMPAVCKPADGCEAITFVCSWSWERGSNRYVLRHWAIDPTTQARFFHQVNEFTWKDVDAVGDAGLVVRWIRQARALMRPDAP